GQLPEAELSSAAQRQQAQKVLAGVGCGEPEPDERPDRLTLPAPRDGLELIEEAAAELRRAGIAVSDLGLRRPTLDDVFLQLTGTPPSEDGGPPPAIGLAEDLERGVVDRFRSMPMARSAVLLGRTVADLVRNVLIIVLMIAVGYVVGFRFHGGVWGALAAILVVSAFGFALSWIFAFVALAVRGAEAAQSAGFVVVFPLVFASSVFVPVPT